MDIRSWKKILMQWISECGFIEMNFFNIEQSDIDAFFANFCKHHFKLGFRDVEDGAVAQYTNGIIGFLQSNYPEFQPHTDDTNSLSAADYLYVYSLLLHYSCVKCPDTFFHEKCQKLSEHAQQGVAWFFNQLMDCEKIDKESIRRAIADIASTTSSPRYNDSHSSSANSSSNNTNNSLASPKHVAPLSPVKTPKKNNTSSQRVSPSTPKTYLLEERTRELYTLRAQLETERYEKGLLEVQIKQYEDRMIKLNLDHKQLKQQIQELKSDLLNRNTDIACHKDGDEHIKRRLCKEISIKEQEISKLTDIISSITEEKGMAQEKLIVSERQILICTERLKELDYRIDELTRELEKKSDMIKYLSDSKDELEHYISEIRSQSTSSRPDYNSSLDSSNGLSPENLGCSVVDLQLREKENENAHLRDELLRLKHSNTHLAKHIHKLAIEYSRELQMDIENFNYNEEESTDPAQNFMIFANCMEKVGKWYKEEINRSNKLQDELMMVREKNEHLSQNVDDMSENLFKLKEVLERLEQSNCDLELAKNELKEKLTKSNEEIRVLNEQKQHLQAKVNQLDKDYGMHLDQCDFDALKSRLEEQSQKINEELAQKAALSKEIEALRLKVQATQEKLVHKTTTYEMDLKTVNQKLLAQKKELEAHVNTEKLVKEKYEELLISYEEMKKDARETDSYLSSTRDEINAKEQKMERLGKEIVLVRTKNKELEERINSLMAECKHTKHTSDMTINMRDEKIREMEAHLHTTNDLLQKTKAELQRTLGLYNNEKIELEHIKEHAFELYNFFNVVPSDDKNVAENFSNIVLKVKENVQQKAEMATKIDCLQMNIDEYKSQIETIRQQLHEAIDEKQSVTHDMNFKLMDKKDELQEKCSHLEQALNEISEKYEIEQKTSEEYKQKLEDMGLESCDDYLGKLQYYHDQLNQLRAENEGINKEMDILRDEHASNLDKFKRVEEIMNCLAKNVGNVNGIDNGVQSQESNANSTTEPVISNEDLQRMYDDAIEKIKEAEDRVNILEELQQQQEETMDNLKAKMQQEQKEKLALTTQIEQVQAKLDFENREKNALLCSLETTADRLREVMDERTTSITQKDKTITDLNEQLVKANEQITRLESHLVEQETELRIALDEHQQEIEKLQMKFTDALDNINGQTEKIEYFNKIIGDVVCVLQKSSSHLDKNYANETDDYIGDILDNRDLHANWHQLKDQLNFLLSNLTGVIAKLETSEEGRKEANCFMEVLNKTNTHLNNQNSRLKIEINELQKMLSTEAKTLESKLGSEIKRLNENIHNIDSINEMLNGENAKLKSKVTSLEEKVANYQMSINMLTEKEKNMLNDLEFKNDIISKMKEEELKHKERTTHMDMLNDKCSFLEMVLHDKTNEYEKQLQQMEELQSRLSEQKQRLEQLEIDSRDKSKENIELKTKINDMSSIRKQFDDQIKVLVRKRDEFEAQYSDLTQTYNKLKINYDRIQKDYEELKRLHDSKNAQLARLNAELNMLQAEKAKLDHDLDRNKQEFSRASENMTQLIQQNSLMCLERDALAEENRTMKMEMEKVTVYRLKAEMKIKEITEQSKSLEAKLIDAESKMSAIRIKVEQSGGNTERLTAENVKLREAQEAATKRIETMAFKMGELQARYAKIERDNDKLCENMQKERTAAQHDKEHLQREVENLQKDKETLQIDSKSLKDRLNHAEQIISELRKKIQFLENTKDTLEKAKQMLEARELDSKSKLLKLEKLREANEEKIRKLDQDLNSSEQTNVRLNLEIGALNSQVNEITKAVDAECKSKIDQITTSYNEAMQKLANYEDVIEKLRAQVTQLEESNWLVSEKLTEMTESLRESKEKCELLVSELDSMQIELNEIREEKRKIQESHNATCAKLESFEVLNRKLNIERDELVANLESKISALKSELEAKNAQIVELQREVEALRKATPDKELTTELESLHVHVNVLKESMEKEQQVSTQLRLDNQILQAKYREAKQRIAEELKASEDRLKENRLEMEGKLEKMKSKMKTLYNEEINKMKVKQERETSHLKSELDVYKTQNNKFEEHVRKLSSEMGRLNDKNLEYKKEIALLTTKMKQLETQSNSFKRPSSLRARTMSTLSAAATSSVDGNFGMEDEEGEVFNNTYLTDLKNGRMSEILSKNICSEELQYRNSLLPPHLKSTYAAQYDHGLAEDEMKDGPQSLDDSMLALLNTTEGAIGTRKKISGATHYKRPGPPTPSKHGGRLSFGGNPEPARAILKETHDDNVDAVSSSSSKTPARFSFFTSRFSMGNVKDENSPPKRRLSNIFKRK